MARFFFEINYNGTHYHGWQNQSNAVGVQQVVEDALTQLFRTPISITGSGRTDAGVHCIRQFFHCDFDQLIEKGPLIQRLNSFLPKDIAIRSISEVKADAHARYDAYERSYQYIITRVKDPLLVGYSYHFFKPLDLNLMNQGATLLIGEHDFESFSKVKTDVNHFICKIKSARWNQRDNLLVFDITANRFLRGMVRAIVGTLIELGTGKIAMQEFKHIMASRDRKKAGMNVPPEGLYLMNVKYPRRIYRKEL